MTAFLSRRRGRGTKIDSGMLSVLRLLQHVTCLSWQKCVCRCLKEIGTERKIKNTESCFVLCQFGWNWNGFIRFLFWNVRMGRFESSLCPRPVQLSFFFPLFFHWLQVFRWICLQRPSTFRLFPFTGWDLNDSYSLGILWKY